MAIRVSTARSASTGRRVRGDLVEAQVLLTCSVSVSVLPAMRPETTATAPYSPRARAVVRTTPYDAPADGRERDAPEGLKARRAERPRGLVLIGPDLAEHRDHLADDEGQRHEDRGEDDPGRREDDLDPVLGEPAAEPAVLAVDEDQREADDDR